MTKEQPQDKLIFSTAKMIEDQLLGLVLQDEDEAHHRSNLALIATGYVIRYERDKCYSTDRKRKAYAFFERATTFITKSKTT